MTDLRMAKVVEVHAEHRSVDLVFLDNGWHCAGVPVLAGTASTSTGTLDLPAPVVGDNKWDAALLEQRDMLAVVGMVGDQPVVMGFILPSVSQMVFQRENFAIRRHASDFVETINDGADYELVHPSGAYLRIGVGDEVEDLTHQDYDARWEITRNNGKSVTIMIRNASGTDAFVRIAPSGDITVQGRNIYLNPQNGIKGVARLGDEVQCPAGIGHIVESSETVFAGD